MDYKNHLWTTLISLAAGIACVLLNKIAPETIVIILGATFVATGVLNIAMLFGNKNKKNETETPKRPSFSGFVSSLAAAILGVWLIIAPEDNVALITRIISIIVILGSGYLLFSMLVYFSNVRFHSVFYILPSALLAVGIWMLVSPMTFASFLVLVIGIILIVYSIAMAMELLVVMAFERKIKKNAKINDIPDYAITEIDNESTDSSIKN